MTVIPFPVNQEAHIRSCVDAYLSGNRMQTIRCTVKVLGRIEWDLHDRGIAQPEIERQLDAFLVKVQFAMIRASAAGL